MKTALLLHGTLGSPDGNWFRWLQNQLELEGYEVWLPTLPHADQPSLREWADYIHMKAPFPLNEETLIVGHSSGSILALVLAQQNDVPIGEIIDVSVFYDNSLKWSPNNRLFDIALDWQKIARNVIKLRFIHSNDDPYVPLEQARHVAENTGGKLIMLPGQGHFNLEKSQSYREFPALLDVLHQD